MHSDPTFLGLPREIRDNILTLLLVDQDVTLGDEESSEDKMTEKLVIEGNNFDSTILPTPIGAILISEVSLENFNKHWKRSSYVRRVNGYDGMSGAGDGKDFDDTGRSLRPTTYCLGCEVGLQLFLVCRQIYHEASYIFYGKNRFFVQTIACLEPFLEDRSAAARKLIQMLSIPVPYGRRSLNTDFDREIYRCRYVSDETFSKACTYLADRPDCLPNLKQLDLRVWGYPCTFYGSSLTPEKLKLSRTQMKQLASVASPQIMAVSLPDWHPLAYEISHDVEDGDLKPTIFARLPEHVRQTIQHYREGTIEGDEDEVGIPLYHARS